MINNINDLSNILINSFMNSSNVFIIGHNQIDFDALGAAVGIKALLNSFLKNSYIIVNDTDYDLERGVRSIVRDMKDKYNIINLEDAKKLMDDNSLLVVVDVNQEYRLSVKDNLDDFKNIIVIDHHDLSSSSVKCDNIYIDNTSSSASEIVSQLLILNKTYFDSTTASIILSGIVLDTKRFKQNTSSKTHELAKKLINNGADTGYVNSLFEEDYEEYKNISNLIINGTLFNEYNNNILLPQKVAFVLNRNKPNTIYKRVELAKASDQMLKFSTDASFVLGHIDKNNIAISARSRAKTKNESNLVEDINVGEILTILSPSSCGGNIYNAGGIIENENIVDIEKRLKNIVKEKILIKN